MTFNSQKEMDQNARKWLAFLVPLILGLSVVGIFAAMVAAGGDDLISALAQAFSK